MAALESPRPPWADQGNLAVLSSPWPLLTHHVHLGVTTAIFGSPRSSCALHHCSLGSQQSISVTYVTLVSSRPSWPPYHSHHRLTTATLVWRLWDFHDHSGFSTATLGFPWLLWAPHGNLELCLATLGQPGLSWAYHGTRGLPRPYCAHHSHTVLKMSCPGLTRDALIFHGHLGLSMTPLSSPLQPLGHRGHFGSPGIHWALHDYLGLTVTTNHDYLGLTVTTTTLKSLLKVALDSLY